MREGYPHTPSIAFRHLPPKEGCCKPVLGVWGTPSDRTAPAELLWMLEASGLQAGVWLRAALYTSAVLTVIKPAGFTICSQPAERDEGGQWNRNTPHRTSPYAGRRRSVQ